VSIEHYVEEPNLSLAWGRALRLVSAPGRAEVTPLIVAITGFDKHGAVAEELRIRNALDDLLSAEGMQQVETVANTIFPRSLWNPASPRVRIYERYFEILPRIRQSTRKNARGTYFERMISAGPAGRENQLDFSISTYLTRPGMRRSALQVAIFDPHRDHSAAAYLGFPCLQHVTFAPSREGLCVNALYATQYMVERAYGNYLGLCRLGQFVSHEMGIPIARLTCLIGIAECEVPKAKLSRILEAVDSVVKGAGD
jgi:hypothetical protein